jgi:hypothetical protein
MANTLTNILPKLLATTLPVLRENAVMPRLVTTGYNVTPQERGKTIDIQVSAAQTAAAVTNSNTPPANSDKTPTTVQINLDKWFETRFHLSDQEMTQIMAPDSQFVPGQIAEGMKALANQADQDLLAEFINVLANNTDGFFGSSGTTPFATEALFNTVYTKGALKALKDANSPLDDIACVIDTAAEANLLSLAKFTDADRVGDQGGIIRGELGTKLGARWVADQNVRTHTNNPTGWLTNQADHAIGDTTITIDTGSNDPAAGDMFTIAGDTTEYHVTGYAANVITYTPAAVVAADDNDALTFTDYQANLCFHRSAFALGSAPLSIANIDPANTNMASIIDPVTGLTVRLEVRRDYKQWTWDMDILYGVKTVREDLAILMLG